MGVYIPINFESVGSVGELPYKTYGLDFEKKRVTAYIDKLEAIKQAAKKLLLTRRYAFCIYNADYGSDLEAAFLGQNIPKEILESELKRLIWDALSVDKRITGIESLDFKLDGDKVYIDMKIGTVLGVAELRA